MPVSNGGLLHALYLNNMVTTDDIMDGLYHTAEHNLRRNREVIDSIETAVMASNQYLDQYASSIARDVACCTDKNQLYNTLRDEVIEAAVSHQVSLAFIVHPKSKIN